MEKDSVKRELLKFFDFSVIFLFLILDNISPIEDGCDVMVLACLSDKGDCYLKIIEVYFEDTKRNRAN